MNIAAELKRTYANLKIRFVKRFSLTSAGPKFANLDFMQQHN